jgi:hypothetical protein
MKLDVAMCLKIGLERPKTKIKETIIMNKTKSTLEVFGMEPTSSQDSTSTTASLPNSSNSLNFQNDDQEKFDAQVLAAKRSLITNLVLTALCVLTNSAIVFLPPDFIPYFTVLILSSIKGALPISTTMANFGTVANVISMYLNYFEK